MNPVRPALLTVAALAAAAIGVRFGLARQAAIARRRIGKPLGEDALAVDRVWRRRLPGDPIDLLIVGTCPDLGALRPVPQPLRTLASRLSRRLAEAQAGAAARAGAASVSLRRTVGPLFLDEPEQMFSLDRFHPSALGYRRTAEALLPVVAAALTAPVAR